MHSVKSALQTTAEMLAQVSNSALLDAEILLCLVLQKNRAFLRAWPEKSLSDQQTRHFQALVQKRRQGTPIAYLIGSREFWSRDFSVTPDVLIPRPETELLIQLALDLIPENTSLAVLDLGTGSGIIAITLAAERPAISVYATDNSVEALDIARANAIVHQTGNIHFHQHYWFNSLPKQQFDLIVSNPPYIASDDPHLQQGDLRFEPQTALIAEQQGLKDIAEIADHARQFLKTDSYLLTEHGYDQQQQVQSIFKKLNFCQIATHRDLSGQSRVTSARWRETT